MARTGVMSPMGVETVLVIAALAIVLVAIPGPVVMLVLKSAVRDEP